MNYYTLKELNWLKENYPVKGSHACALHLNRPLASVRQTANNMGVHVPKELRNKLHSNTLIKKFIPTISPDIFRKVNTKEAAYVMGILWADGWIVNKNYYSVDIKLVKEDFDVIMPIFNKLGTWKKYEYFPKNRKPVVQLRVSGKEIVDIFLSLGYDAKSHNSAKTVLMHIPKKLREYWWRGYFDGDGHIKIGVGGYKRLELASAWNQDWSFLPRNVPFKINIVTGKNSYSKARLSSRKNILKFGNFIWKTRDRIGLSRKYEEFNKLR
jgi:hypothetical protein